VKYAVVTFGCRVNQADSLGFEEELRRTGALAVSPAEADLVVVNTCSVTATADQGARQTIRRIARENPAARIVVTGCYATRRPDELEHLPGVLRVIPNDAKPRMIHIVSGDRGLTTAERFGDGDGSCGAPIEPGVAGRTAFTLRVQTGCAEPCSYCIIPSTRGVPRSLPLSAVLAEVDRIVGAGFKEIAITGVHLGSYGRDLSPASSLIELLFAIDEHSARLQPKVLFRVSSLEPMDCTPEVVDLLAASDRFAHHFHLPLQHASDRVLASMRRPYTLAHYATLVDSIRACMPHASIGSDVIVGFPGETDIDFERLTTYLDESPLTHIHVFPYSDRPGTAASVMREKVPGGVIRERGRRVREIGQRLVKAFRDAQVGTIRRALTIDDGSIAVSDNYLRARIPPGRSRNEWVHVKMMRAEDPMVGEVLSD
jgi:threonylcarbamoyladenosine tRNA methylthiotransferase MtaB